MRDFVISETERFSIPMVYQVEKKRTTFLGISDQRQKQVGKSAFSALVSEGKEKILTLQQSKP